MEIHPKQIVLYQKEDGEFPFETWMTQLSDVKGRAIIQKRINRVRLGNMGDSKSVGDGVFELRINFGPGYRVYFGSSYGVLILLLLGGNKASQAKDIMMAKKFWQNYLKTKP